MLPVRSGDSNCGFSLVPLSAINTKKITITYDNAVLEVNDLCTFSKTDEIAIGPISGTDFEVYEITDGKIVIQTQMNLGQDTWSGTATVLRFKAKTNGSTDITTEITNR